MGTTSALKMSSNGRAGAAREAPSFARAVSGPSRAISRGDPETLNFDNPDPFAEGIDLVRGRARAMKINYVLSNGFGLGGVNASVVLRKM
jgi:3-oxoacyl-[acyl-carrier-protein] synthase II